MSEFLVGDGINTLMAKRGDVPASHEWYPIDGLAFAVGTQGLYIYTPKTGTRFVPFE